MPALLGWLGSTRVVPVLLSPGAPARCQQEQYRIQNLAPLLWHDLTRYADASGGEQSCLHICGTKPELLQLRDFGDSHPGLAGCCGTWSSQDTPVRGAAGAGSTFQHLNMPGKGQSLFAL